MAIAYKCDRCGELFDKKTEVAKFFNPHGAERICEVLDFCPKCYGEFLNWFEEGKTDES